MSIKINLPAGETLAPEFAIETLFPKGQRSLTVAVFTRPNASLDHQELCVDAGSLSQRAEDLRAKRPLDAAIMSAAYNTLTNG